ncbi:MAG: hypothetical protein H6581_18495 [Bacteroidia bacterium]|nr:hypothetical protein [Bacteroidia bacterium]
MKNLFLILSYFLRSLLAFQFRQFQHKHWYFTGKTLLETKPFWMPEALLQSPWSAFVVFRQTLKEIWTRPRPGKVKWSNAPVAILDGRMTNQKLRRNYVESFTHEQVGIFVCLGELVFSSGLAQALLKTSFLLFWSLIFLPWYLFSRHRVNYAGFPGEILSLAALLKILERDQIRTVYSFFIFRGFSNLEALVLKKKGITINKVTSLTPLAFHNHSTIADKLIVNTHYQIEEIPHFQHSLLVNAVEHWGPEQSLLWKEKYHAEAEFEPPVAQIGYYSSGHWLRKKNQHLGTGRGDLESDETLQQYLKEYLLARPGLKLAIFTHPMEKVTPGIRAEAEAHYRKIFKGIDLEVMPAEMSTMGNLEYVDVAVGVISSALAERLYFGFKAIFAPFSLNVFPLTGTSIVPIAPREKQEFFNLLDRSLEQTRAEFFQINALESYKIQGEVKFYPELTRKPIKSG